MQSNDFIRHTGRLRALGGQRVWSLMISLFGDLAQGKGDVIDGPVLTATMTMLQVKPEAARVALHRLRKDGWITSQKSGRISQHALTAKGRGESAAASPRIYAQPDEGDPDWQLVLVEDNSSQAHAELIGKGFAPLTNRVYVASLTATPPSDALRLTGGAVPRWLPAQLAPSVLHDEYKALFETLVELTDNLPDPSAASALETAVLRCLIVHNWRRLVLKHPQLPQALIADDWLGLACHRLVADLLNRFPRPTLSDLRQEQATA